MWSIIVKTGKYRLTLDLVNQIMPRRRATTAKPVNYNMDSDL